MLGRLVLGRRRWWAAPVVASKLAGVVLIAALAAASQAPGAGADTAKVQHFVVPTPDSGPTDITKGPGGKLWFTETYADKVASITPAGAFSEYHVTGSPTAITVGGDGNLWFLEPRQGLIGRLTPAGVLTEFSTGITQPPSFDVGAITKGPDGNVWYTQESAGVGRITPAGTITDFAIPNAPSVITVGSDGNLWFGLQFAPSIGRISPAGTDYTEFPLPPSGNFIVGATLSGISAGTGGNVWYTTSANVVGYVTPTGSFTQFQVPTPGSQPFDLTLGPDGNMWFTETNGSRVARVTPDGEIREVLVPGSIDNSPVAITSGPNGKLWFTEPYANAVGNLDPATLTPPPGPCLTVSHNTVLTHDVGPCKGDGILVTGSHFTLDLGGHRVYSAKGRRVGDFAGIHLQDTYAVTVKHGEVTGFDAGVWLDHGAANRLTDLNVHDNRGPANVASQLGDGIALFHSAGNQITHNVIAHNGPFDGIGVLGLGSNDNTIAGNQIRFNTDQNTGSSNFGGGTGVIINSFLEAEALGRGESLSHNDVIGNVIAHNVSSGISSLSNDSAQIKNNRLTDNGFRADGSGGNRSRERYRGERQRGGGASHSGRRDRQCGQR